MKDSTEHIHAKGKIKSFSINHHIMIRYIKFLLSFFCFNNNMFFFLRIHFIIMLTTFIHINIPYINIIIPPKCSTYFRLIILFILFKGSCSFIPFFSQFIIIFFFSSNSTTAFRTCIFYFHIIYITGIVATISSSYNWRIIIIYSTGY